MSRAVRGIEEVDPTPSVVTIGMFDGVHRGHRAIVDRAVHGAAARGQRGVAVTFDRHPAEVIRPGSQPTYLQTLPRKVEALLGVGVDLVVALPFTEKLSQLSPQAFVEHVLAGPLRTTRVVVGTNFRFGHRAAGDIGTLRDLGREHGFEVEAVDLLDLEGRPISSTAVREHLSRGEVARAADALGRPFVLEGVVVKGDGRGRAIGIPTANLEVADRLQAPASGVYAGHAWVVGAPESHYAAAINLGTRPTFGGDTPTLEVHLLDVDLDLYGEHLAVSFRQRLRHERRFAGPEELVQQIRQDLDRARAVLER